MPQQFQIVPVGMGVALLVKVEVALQCQFLQGRRDRKPFSSFVAGSLKIPSRYKEKDIIGIKEEKVSARPY